MADTDQGRKASQASIGAELGAAPRQEPRANPSQAAAEAGTCEICGHPLTVGSAYLVGSQHRCLRCALRYGPMLRRSALTALVVGSALVAINQGTLLWEGALPPSLLWKVPLTYAVPFCVATWGALSNSHV